MEYFFLCVLQALPHFAVESTSTSPLPMKPLWCLWLGNPLGSVFNVIAECDCVNFWSWLQGERDKPETSVCCFALLSAMSLLTPPPLLVKSGQWKLFLVSVCQAPPWDYRRSGRVCLVNIFSLISIEACSAQKPACGTGGIPAAGYKTMLISLVPLTCISGPVYFTGKSHV